MATMLVQNLKQNSSPQAHRVVSIVCVCTCPLHHVMGMLANNVDIQHVLDKGKHKIPLHNSQTLFSNVGEHVLRAIPKYQQNDFQSVASLVPSNNHTQKLSMNSVASNQVLSIFLGAFPSNDTISTRSKSACKFDTRIQQNPYTCAITQSPIINLRKQFEICTPDDNIDT